ncbi:MAG: pyruvate kinase, partial [Spirochaetales bacterium]|nr:pyruvate kinase [Spirochaetales bacterium]
MKKFTKIVATISTVRCEEDFLKKLFDAGMNVVRLNTAHMSLEDADFVVKRIRKISDTIGIMLDTKGPEVRTCEFEPIKIASGDKIKIFDKGVSGDSARGFNVNYANFSKEVDVTCRILIDDGEIE